MALSLPSPSVSKTITVASAMPGIFCAVGNAKVYCFGVVCDESHSSAQQGWCLPYHAHISYYINISARVLQPAACHEPRSTRPGARFRRAKRGTVSAMASAQVRSRERSVVCLDCVIIPEHSRCHRDLILSVHVCCACRLRRATSHAVLVRVQGFGVPSGVPCPQWQVRRCDHVRKVLAAM